MPVLVKGDSKILKNMIVKLKCQKLLLNEDEAADSVVEGNVVCGRGQNSP